MDRSQINRSQIDRNSIDRSSARFGAVDRSAMPTGSVDSGPVPSGAASPPGQPEALLAPIQANLWAHKPWWCQPWSILLTGVVAIAGSWLVLARLWITLPCAALVLLWWWLFLVLVPAAYRAEASAAVEVQQR
jgi:hypothetical protein